LVTQPNAGHEPRLEAEAQRKLEGVGSMPMFGQALPRSIGFVLPA
jgi:hypothetical protein